MSLHLLLGFVELSEAGQRMAHLQTYSEISLLELNELLLFSATSEKPEEGPTQSLQC